MLDARTFRLDAISAETLTSNAMIASSRGDLLNVPANATLFRQRFAEAMRRSAGGAIYSSALARQEQVNVPGGSIKLRIFAPTMPARAVLVFLHGGGWVIGSPDAQDKRLEQWAQTGIAIIAPQYPLAPEFPFPAGLDVCEAAARWALEHCQTLFGTQIVAIGGESAGANLAASVALRLRREEKTPLAALALFYGLFDLSMTPSQRRFGNPPGMMGRSLLGWFYDQYVPAERRKDPEVSPLYADLSGLPPALFIVGMRDPLLDDSLFMHARWLAAGNESQIWLAPGGVHAFNTYPTAIAMQANEAVTRYLHRQFERGII